MSDILGRLGGLADMGADALLTAMAAVIDGMGTVTEWSGEQLDRLGELEQQLADLARSARGG
jgi:hypothetical protein